MTPITFTIPGKPFGKQRPKAGKSFTGKTVMRTPTETRQFEQAVGWIARPLFRDPILGPVRLIIEATHPLPLSWSDRKRAAMMGKPCTAKPDADNISKAIKDGLNRIAWADDQQVADLRVVKIWGPQPGQTIVKVEALE